MSRRYHVMELAGFEDLGASQEPQGPELPHDVLARAVRQAGVPLRVAGQGEHGLQHPLHVLPEGEGQHFFKVRVMS